jgi:hypothetical protein
VQLDIPWAWGRPLDAPDPEVLARIEQIPAPLSITRYHFRAVPLDLVTYRTIEYRIRFLDPFPGDGVLLGRLQVQFDGNFGDLQSIKIFDSHGRISMGKVEFGSNAAVEFSLSLESCIQQELTCYPIEQSLEGGFGQPAQGTTTQIHGRLLTLDVVETITVELERQGWVVTNAVMDPTEGQEGADLRHSSWKVFGSRLERVAPVTFAIQLKGIQQLHSMGHTAIAGIVDVRVTVRMIAQDIDASDRTKLWHDAILETVRHCLEQGVRVTPLTQHDGPVDPRFQLD